MQRYSHTSIEMIEKLLFFGCRYIELDIFSKKSGKGTPFLDAYKTLLDKYVLEKSDHDSADEIINNLLRLGESIGDLIKKKLDLLNRQALHAKTLGLLHPKTKKPVYYESKIPNDFIFYCPSE